MPSKCESLKAEYASLLTLKEEFDSAYEEAVRTGNLDRAKELRAELEKKMATLKDKLWPFEYLPQKELKRQYESQRETFQRVGILETLPSGELGIKGIDGKTYPFPTYEEIRKRIKNNKEVLNLKTEQGFNQLLIVPFGMKLSDLIEKYKAVILNHYVSMPDPNDSTKRIPDPQRTKLFATKEKPTDPDKPLKLDEKTPVYVWDQYQDADTNGQLVYYPKEFSENHQGKTKTELLKEGGAWDVIIIENNPNIPREGANEAVGKGERKRKRIEANKTPNEYLEAIGQDQYQNESGQTPEEWLIQALTLLEEKNQVLDDYQGKGSLAYLTGVYFKSGNVPCAYWFRGHGRASLGRHDPADRYPFIGVRSAVRVLKS